MYKIFIIFKFLIFSFLYIPLALSSESQFFIDGKKFFNQSNFEKSKFYFEKDIVFNPKSEMSYLYLAKIFENKDDKENEEFNLNTVLVLNPKNEEAIYMLMNLKIKKSDFSETDKLLKRFNLVCVSLCSKADKIQKKLDNLSSNSNKTN